MTSYKYNPQLFCVIRAPKAVVYAHPRVSQCAINFLTFYSVAKVATMNVSILSLKSYQGKPEERLLSFW